MLVSPDSSKGTTLPPMKIKLSYLAPLVSIFLDDAPLIVVALEELAESDKPELAHQAASAKRLLAQMKLPD